jgi:trehalose-phosphatase
MVSLASHRLLMLDYDGTLAPFRAVRTAAKPLPASRRIMQRMARRRHTTIAVVSGRPVREIETLLGQFPGMVVGEHGWEHREPGAPLVCAPLPPPAVAALDEASRRATEAGWGERLERKRSAVVLHTRSLAPAPATALQTRCLRMWRDLADSAAVRMDRTNGGVELRARGRDKGTAVLSMMSRMPPGTLGVFVGDDVSDEDAFDVVREWGFGVRVGRREGSRAMAWLESHASVPEFLVTWRSILEHGRTRTRTVPETA